MWQCQYSDTHHETSFRILPENIFSCHLFIFYSQCYTVLADNIGVSHQCLLSRMPRRYRRQIPTKFFRPGPVKILRGLINVPFLLYKYDMSLKKNKLIAAAAVPGKIWRSPEHYTGASTFATPPLVFPLFLVAGNSCFNSYSRRNHVIRTWLLLLTLNQGKIVSLTKKNLPFQDYWLHS
jgi:hypothetical protein